MSIPKKVVFSPEDMAKMEIRNFINEGLKDIQDNNLFEYEEVFDKLERRYDNA